MSNPLKVRYVDASMKQLARAMSQLPNRPHKIVEGDTYESILSNIKKNEANEQPFYKNYDKWGRLTVVGKEVRKFFLKKYNLDENATVEQFLSKQSNDFIEDFKKRIKHLLPKE